MDHIPQGVLVGAVLGLVGVVGFLAGGCLWFIRELYVIMKERIESLDANVAKLHEDVVELKASIAKLGE